MESIGFFAVDIFELHYAGKLLFQVDILFRRKNPVEGLPQRLFQPVNGTASRTLVEALERIKQTGL